MPVRNNPEEQKRIAACTDEIRATLKKYDFAGVFAVSGKDTSRYFFEVEPSWSCLTLEKTPGGGFGVRFKAAMKTGSAAEKQRGLDTVGLVMGLLDAANTNVEQLTTLAKLIGKHVEISHEARGIDET
jgi:hypothetical protein